MDEMAALLNRYGVGFEVSGLGLKVTMQNLTSVEFDGISNIAFEKCDFSGVDFTRMNIMNATFSECNLENTIFGETSISGCNFVRCNMQSAKFDVSGVSYSTFLDSYGCDVSIVSSLLNSVTFEKTRFDFADLSHSIIKNSYFKQASFRVSTLTKMDVSKSKFITVDFCGSDAHGSSFDECNIDDLSFRNIDLSIHGELRELAISRGFLAKTIDVDTKYITFKDCIIANSDLPETKKRSKKARNYLITLFPILWVVNIFSALIFNILTTNPKEYSYMFHYDVAIASLPYGSEFAYNPRLPFLIAPLINAVVTTLSTIIYINTTQFMKINATLLWASLCMNAILCGMFWTRSLETGIIWLSLLQLPFAIHMMFSIRYSKQVRVKAPQ